MAVISLRVEVGDEVHSDRGVLGRVQEIFAGPPRSNFVDAEQYMLVKSPQLGMLYIPFSAIADVSRLWNVVILKPRDPSVEYGDWRRDPRRPAPASPQHARIGDQFREGDLIVQPGEYVCTACGFRRHSSQLREDSGSDRFPAPHHLGAAWALDDYRL
jgi:hypothetical protein